MHSTVTIKDYDDDDSVPTFNEVVDGDCVATMWVRSTAGITDASTLVMSPWPAPPTPDELAEDPRLSDVPTTLLRQATVLDKGNVMTAYRPGSLREAKIATAQLDTSSLTRLIAYVDNDDVWAGSTYSFVDTGFASEMQTRRWFKNWSSAIAPATLGGGLTRARLLAILREARRRLRAHSKPRPRTTSTASRVRQQLDRLANFITPHAPPHGLLARCPAGVATLHLTALA